MMVVHAGIAFGITIAFADGFHNALRETKFLQLGRKGKELAPTRTLLSIFPDGHQHILGETNSFHLAQRGGIIATAPALLSMSAADDKGVALLKSSGEVFSVSVEAAVTDAVTPPSSDSHKGSLVKTTMPENNKAGRGFRWTLGGTCQGASSQSCETACGELGLQCDAQAIWSLNSTSLRAAADEAGVFCCSLLDENVAGGWDGPWVQGQSCAYNSNPGWRPSCSSKARCGFSRLCPCATTQPSHLLHYGKAPLQRVFNSTVDLQLRQRPRLMTWEDLEHYRQLVVLNRWDTKYPHGEWFNDYKVPGLGGGDATLKWGFLLEMAFALGVKKDVIGLNVGSGDMPHGFIFAPHIEHMIQTDFGEPSSCGNMVEVISGDWYNIAPKLLMRYQGKVGFVIDSCSVTHFRPAGGLNRTDPFRNGCFSVGKHIYGLLKQGGYFFTASDVNLKKNRFVTTSLVGAGYGELSRDVHMNHVEEWEEFMHPEDLLTCYKKAGLELVGSFSDKFETNKHYNFPYNGVHLGIVAAMFRKPLL